MDPEERPTTILAEDPLAPQGPWAFLKEAIPGGFTPWGWGLLGGWVLVFLGPATGWAGHLRRAADWSALPAHWGEQISARDVWELLENGGIKQKLVNSPTVHLFGLGLVVVLWCGWRMQAESAGLKARLGSWLLGGLDTLLIGLVPLGGVAWLLDWLLDWAGGTGIDGLGWTALFARPLLWMACLSTLNLQWWFCRLGRAAGLARGYRAHLAECFFRLWTHPIQWGALAAGGALLRALPPFLLLLLAWRMGGGTTFRVWLFLLLQLAATTLNGWLLGWLLRTTALFWKHDAEVRTVRAALTEAVPDAQAL